MMGNGEHLITSLRYTSWLFWRRKAVLHIATAGPWEEDRVVRNKMGVNITLLCHYMPPLPSEMSLGPIVPWLQFLFDTHGFGVRCLTVLFFHGRQLLHVQGTAHRPVLCKISGCHYWMIACVYPYPLTSIVQGRILEDFLFFLLKFTEYMGCDTHTVIVIVRLKKKNKVEKKVFGDLLISDGLDFSPLRNCQ